MAEPQLYLDILGTSGLRRTGGYVLEEFLRQLKGPKGMELLKEFTHNNPQAGAIRALLYSLARQVSWDVIPNEKPKTPEGSDRAVYLIETAKDDMEHSWNDYIAEQLSMSEFGHAEFEIIYKMRRGPGGPAMVESKYDDGMIGWRRVELRSQDSIERWEFDPNTFDLKGFWQRDNYVSRYVFIPIDRCVHFRTEKYKNNPEGRSLFRNAVIPYLRLKNIEDIEAVGIERDLTGLPTMEMPIEFLSPTASQDMKAVRLQIERLMGGIKSNERAFALVPASKNSEGKDTGWKFSLMASPGQRTIDIVKVKDSYKTDILQVFLAQFIQMGVQSNAVGSFAQADSATNMFGLAFGALLDNQEETMNRQQIDPLLGLNSVEAGDYCKLKHGDVETPDLVKLGGYVRELFNAGFVGPQAEKLKQKLYEFAGLPYEPQEQQSQAAANGEVKTADQLIAEVMGGSQQGDDQAQATPMTSTPGGLKTADQLIAEVMPNGAPGALNSGADPSGSPAMGSGATPVVTPAATGDGQTLQDTAMNGSQITSLLEVITQVATQQISRESGLAVLQLAFRLSPKDAISVLGPQDFKPDASQAPAAPGGFGAKPPGQGGPPHGTAPHAGGIKTADEMVAEVTKPK